jgi:hypothetical protein
MRKNLCIVAAAASLTVAGLAFAQQGNTGTGGSSGTGATGGQGQGQTGTAGDINRNRPTGEIGGITGGSQSTAQSSSDVKRLIGECAAAILSQDGGLNDVAIYLSSNDRQRLSSGLNQENAQVKQQIQQLRDAYRQKYNKDLNLRDSVATAFADKTSIRIIQGDVVDTARLAGERIGGAGTGGTDASGGTGGTGATGGIGNSGTPGSNTTPGTGSPDVTPGHTPGVGGADRSADRAASDISSRLAGDMMTVILPAEGNAPTVVLHVMKDNVGATGGGGIGSDRTGTGAPGAGATGAGATGAGATGAGETGTGASGIGANGTGATGTGATGTGATGTGGMTGSGSVGADRGGISGSAAASAIGGDWKIDLPDTVDAQKLQENLQKHLTMMNDQKDEWPSDENQTTRLITQHVLAALTDADSTRTGAPGAGSGGMNRSSGTDQNRSGTGAAGSGPR